MLIGIKLYAHGKIYYTTNGPAKYKKQAIKALKSPGVCSIKPFISKRYFENAMREEGIPDNLIKEFINEIWVDDDHVIVHPDPTW